MTTLAQNLKKSRKAAGFKSQQEAADAIGIKRSLLGAIEEGRCQPNLIIFPTIIRVYKIRNWQALILDENYEPTDPKY